MRKGGNQCQGKELSRIFASLITSIAETLHPKVTAMPWYLCELQHIFSDQNPRFKIFVFLLTMVASCIYFRIAVVWFRNLSELCTNTVWLCFIGMSFKSQIQETTFSYQETDPFFFKSRCGRKLHLSSVCYGPVWFSSSL